ncbi:MAG: hypothetical protein GY906_14750 [bacterium]|nr:hypothetical protein [bacterium]
MKHEYQGAWHLSLDDFIKTEYEQCIQLMERYDARQVDLVRYATLLSCGAVSNLLGLSN